MPISSSSLFHFTSGDLNILKKILENGFLVSKSEEILRSQYGKSDTHFNIPMVCFCDIPLSLIESHIKIYCFNNGEKVFGIGMNKDWGINNKLNPVIYINNESYLKQSFDYIEDIGLRMAELESKFQRLLSDNEKQPEANAVLKILEKSFSSFNVFEDRSLIRIRFELPEFNTDTFLSRIFLFLKPYSGNYFHNGRNVGNHIYYNEREWRYVPEGVNIINAFCSDYNPKLIEIIHAIKKISKEEIINSLRHQFDANRKVTIDPIYQTLSFKPEDISFIIVNDSNDVEELIRYLLESTNFRVGGNEIADINSRYTLISKILSYDQIKNDIFSH
ncbi:abortive infection system antitoxin AbiGi family protein [Arundinibacter roseus]|uniref:Uncharacterized protein n=1 Tax=Arundinibacter roseus TaxID=2070510 RepID=A0A4R4KH45_9BACT|nr:abortive infection system antitoxin AbiGi family protein [Arundinibacter roseus]TDB67123.1 hypothetical protein EZE20_08395 [Arundinibacter roseus]